ncbi:MAG: DUF1549 and DUF1553 domain-containing protein [Verrucomicrobiota bacterium]|nr:DUF1549 and DUF1553 domain-containing protein [Verrucomicrobiota bacterium]MEE2615696.1 DUF1549 and DUF1553 domain-containing protein [Verrucomicrobiota bacterium]
MGFLPCYWVVGSDSPASHWAYVSPERPKFPRLNDVNPIDHFITERLNKSGMRLSRLADPEKQLRRVYLDLIGRPPQPDESQSFLSSPTDLEYNSIVDRLLASPQYGEKWARRWLDLARYADSNGFQADQLRDSWAYRDWVIEAFNSGMPLDKFTVEQLAGDLLPKSTVSQKIATGFHRTPTCNVEAGVHPESNRINQVIDRVNTTGTVFLGTTFECAQCHDHKYDPISMKEYYQLFAFFNNTPLEVRNTSGVTWDFYGPKLDLPLSPLKLGKMNSLKDEMKACELEKKSIKRSLGVEQKEWENEILDELKNAPKWEVFDVGEFSATGGSSYTVKQDQSVLVHGENPDSSTYSIIIKDSNLDRISSVRLEALLDVSMKKNGPGRNFGVPENPNFVLNEFSLKVDGRKVIFSDAKASFSQKKFDVLGAIDNDVKSGWAVNPQFGKAHQAVFTLKQDLLLEKGSRLEFKLVQHHGGGRTIGRLRLSGIEGDYSKVNLPTEIQSILLMDNRNDAQVNELAGYYASMHPRLKELESRLADLKKKLDDIDPETTLIMSEMNKPRETKVMMRGDYLTLGDKVSPGTPAALHVFDDSLPKNRLGLAQWLVDPENPLTSRVFVNRWWSAFMGRGIVETQEDFGSQGEIPSHPELLDWLAIELVQKGWSMKHIHKLIVTSHTYRQSSIITKSHLKKDPANRLYARAPRVRMSAEMIRDSALATSGLLETKMFGPPVYPPQPEGIWRHVGRNAPKFLPAENENRFRRAVYVVWRRGAPYASFVNFDAPDRGACVVDRPRTNTPLQALTLLNDQAFVEMGLAFAARILQEPGLVNDEQRIQFAFRVALARSAKQVEVDYLKVLLIKRKNELIKSPKAIDALLSEAKWVPFKTSNPEGIAKWFTVANILLNLDEAITKG